MIKRCSPLLLYKFRSVDQAKEGYITARLFFDELHKKGILLGLDEKQQVVANHANREGRIRYAEFLRVFDFMVVDEPRNDTPEPLLLATNMTLDR